MPVKFVLDDTVKDPQVVLVTGGSGLVGRALQDDVGSFGTRSEEWIFLSSKDGDLREMKVVKKLFETHRPTYVIHLAAFVGGLFDNMRKKVSTTIHDSHYSSCMLDFYCHISSILY